MKKDMMIRVRFKIDYNILMDNRLDVCDYLIMDEYTLLRKNGKKKIKRKKENVKVECQSNGNSKGKRRRNIFNPVQTTLWIQ